MTDVRAFVLAGSVLFTACARQRVQRVADTVVTPTVTGTEDVTTVVVDAGGRDAVAVSDAHVQHLSRAVLPAAWRHMPTVNLASAHQLSAWEQPPDLDGDGTPDSVYAVAWDARTMDCIANDPAHPCPTSAPDDTGGNDRDGPMLVAYIAVLSLDNSQDGGTLGRCFGTRRLWQSTTGVETTRVGDFEFGEFGPAVRVRATLDTRGSHGVDTLDVVDLYAGTAYERHAGAIVQHCTRVGGGASVRTGSVAVAYGGLTPLVWRAVQAHGFSGCAVGTDAYDASLGGYFSRGAAVTVTTTTPAGTRPHVGLRFINGALRLASDGTHTGTDGGDAPTDPFTLGGIKLQDVTRVCAMDRVRYTLDGHRCDVEVTRDDGALPYCEEVTSPLDPRPARAVSLVPGPDGVQVLYTRGGTALSVTLPPRCVHARRVEARPWQGALPAGLSVSPDGTRVLASNGFDLWLYLPGRWAPVLLNPPGGALPRGTIRAVGFADDGRAAAVISEDFVTFDVTVTDEDTAPSDVRIDPSEIATGLRGR